MRKIMKLLSRYEKTSGQVVNKMKTKLFLGGMSYTRKVAISAEIGIRVANLPKKYMKVKIVSRRVNREVVSNVVDNLSTKHTRIQGRMMPFTSRVELVKSVMEGSLIYSMGSINGMSAPSRNV